MPTELTPPPFRLSQQFPISIEHPKGYANMFGNPSSSGRDMNMGLHQYQHQPTSTNAYAQRYPQYTPSAHSHSRSSQHHPRPQGQPMMHPGMMDNRPNKVLPNGLRNPWAAYAGETYIPGSEKASRMSGDQMYSSSPLHPVASLRSHNSHSRSHSQSQGGPISITASTPIPIPIPVPSVMSSGWTGTGGGMGGMRLDEGWDGSQGRAHLGYMPDPTSTAGRLSRTPDAMSLGSGSGGWRQGPSSWQNHARLTPNLLPPPISMSFVPSGVSLSRSDPNQRGEYLQVPPGHQGRSVGESRRIGSSLRPRRTSFVLPGEECPRCPSSPGGGGGGLKRANSSGKNQVVAMGGRERRASIQSGSRPAVGSPLGRVAGLPDEDERRRRAGSGSSSRHSSGRG